MDVFLPKNEHVHRYTREEFAKSRCDQLIPIGKDVVEQSLQHLSVSIIIEKYTKMIWVKI